MHRYSAVLFNDNLEAVYTAPDNFKERNSGILAYYKPSYGLVLLREQILGKARFDEAFKQYIERWAYKHPTPDDFFRTIENVSGEELNWFWRGWFINNWKLDQGISWMSYVGGDPSYGAVVTIENMQQMPMPVVLEFTTESGNKTRHKLPVEIWKRNKKWTFKYNSKEALKRIEIDPDNVFPDINPRNNRWTPQMAEKKAEKLSTYFGIYTSEVLKMEVKISEKNGDLISSAIGWPELSFSNIGNGKFISDDQDLEIQFNSNKSEFELKISGQVFKFIKK